MKPNYDAMSWKELRAYILQNRHDLDAMEAFFARRSPDSEATWFSPPKTLEEWKQQEEVFKVELEKQLKKQRDTP
ncbi:DUF6887 family protein [Phormidesmis sp. 146-35]